MTPKRLQKIQNKSIWPPKENRLKENITKTIDKVREQIKEKYYYFSIIWRLNKKAKAAAKEGQNYAQVWVPYKCKHAYRLAAYLAAMHFIDKGYDDVVFIFGTGKNHTIRHKDFIYHSTMYDLPYHHGVNIGIQWSNKHRLIDGRWEYI